MKHRVAAKFRFLFQKEHAQPMTSLIKSAPPYAPPINVIEKLIYFSNSFQIKKKK